MDEEKKYTMEFEYAQARAILRMTDPSFYTLIMAAMLKADTTNLKMLTALFPEIAEETERLYRK